MATSDPDAPATLGQVSSLFAVVGVFCVIAIIAFVFAIMAYSALSGRFERVAKLEAYLYAHGTLPPRPVPAPCPGAPTQVIWEEDFSIDVAPDESVALANVSSTEPGNSTAYYLVIRVQALIGETGRPSGIARIAGRQRPIEFASDGSGVATVPFPSELLATAQTIAVSNNGDIDFLVQRAEIRESSSGIHRSRKQQYAASRDALDALPDGRYRSYPKTGSRKLAKGQEKNWFARIFR